jgi:hypothetical protein
MNEANDQVCACNPCVGSSCTCGCQGPAAPAACECGSECRCEGACGQA